MISHHAVMRHLTPKANIGSKRGNLQSPTDRDEESDKPERMERGHIVRENCHRVVLKNLRGWLMSVPPRPGLTGALPGCPEAAEKPSPVEAAKQ